jgi:hypothetical protein
VRMCFILSDQHCTGGSWKSDKKKMRSILIGKTESAHSTWRWCDSVYRKVLRIHIRITCNKQVQQGLRLQQIYKNQSYFCTLPKNNPKEWNWEKQSTYNKSKQNNWEYVEQKKNNSENYKHFNKKFKTSMKGKISHIHGTENLILWRWQ